MVSLRLTNAQEQSEMKLISYELQGKPGWGAIDAGDAMSPEPDMLVHQLCDAAQTSSLKTAIESGFLDQAASHLKSAKTLRFGDLTLKKPIPDPEKTGYQFSLLGSGWTIRRWLGVRGWSQLVPA